MNNRGFFRVLGFTAAVLIAAAIALQATAAELRAPEIKGTPRPDILWVWSTTSPAVNTATSALASGHVTRAVRLAGTAATTVSVPTDRLIAIHTLCLARLAQGDLGAADVHCRAALATPDTTPVILRRGAFVAVSDATGDDALELGTIIRTNVTQAYGAAAAESYARTVAAW